jgi:hypothetical protein
MCACGGAPSAPSDGQIAGAWAVNSILDAASGGDCVGPTLEEALPARDVFLTALKQSTTTLDATVTSQGNGTSCAFSGVRGSAISLNLTSCQTDRVPAVRCRNGEVREVRLISETISASISDRTSGTGTDTSSWNVYVSGSATPLGTLTLRAKATWNFLGLPSSDYHVFTGTIFPGYADGTISIEGTDAFCTPCGWFPH